MEVHESHLQVDRTIFPPVTRDVPQPPGVPIPEVLDPFADPPTDDEPSEER
jgi:hypothetical protein